MKIYPVSETQLSTLKLWALLSLLIVPVPFFIFHVVRLVSRLRKHTKFRPDGDTAVYGGAGKTYIGAESPHKYQYGGCGGGGHQVGKQFDAGRYWYAPIYPASVSFEGHGAGGGGSTGSLKIDRQCPHCGEMFTSKTNPTVADQ